MMPSAVTIPSTLSLPVPVNNSGKRKLGFSIDDIVGDEKCEKALKIKENWTHSPPPAHQNSRSSLPPKVNPLSKLSVSSQSISQPISMQSSFLSSKPLDNNSNISSSVNSLHTTMIPVEESGTSNPSHLSSNHQNHHRHPYHPYQHQHQNQHHRHNNHNLNSQQLFQEVAAAAAASAAASSHSSPYFALNSRFPFDYQMSYHQWLLARHSPVALQAGFAGSPISPFMLTNRKVKRIRTAFNPQQLIDLENAFAKNHYIVGRERKQLADTLNLSETQVKVWFQNRRTKHKRQKQDEENSFSEDGLGKSESNNIHREKRMNRDYDSEIEDEMDTEDEEKEEEIERSRKDDLVKEEKSLYNIKSAIINSA